MRRLLVLAAATAVVGVLLAPVASVQAATWTCPEPATQANFDADKYLGDWFEMQRVPRTFEEEGECGTAHYEWNKDKTAVDVTNSNYVPSAGQIVTVKLVATPDPVDGATTGKFTVKIKPDAPGAKYWVLGTDYDTYAVVYSCAEPTGSNMPHVTLWVLTKDVSKFTTAVETKVKDILATAGLDGSILRPVQHQQGCPTSTCDKLCATPLAEGLDLGKLKGRWWEVQHSLYSTGSDKQSCSLADLSSTTDGLKMSAKTFETSSADGAGKDVEMILEGTWTNSAKKSGDFSVAKDGKLCIIGTDYENWAVMSVCLPAAAGEEGRASAISGGVFVLARGRGLNSTHQMAANKAVLQAGVPPATMQATPSSPCPAAAADTDKDNGGPSVAVTSPVAVLLCAVTAVLAGRFRQAQ